MDGNQGNQGQLGGSSGGNPTVQQTPDLLPRRVGGPTSQQQTPQNPQGQEFQRPVQNSQKMRVRQFARRAENMQKVQQSQSQRSSLTGSNQQQQHHMMNQQPALAVQDGNDFLFERASNGLQHSFMAPQSSLNNQFNNDSSSNSLLGGRVAAPDSAGHNSILGGRVVQDSVVTSHSGTGSGSLQIDASQNIQNVNFRFSSAPGTQQINEQQIQQAQQILGQKPTQVQEVTQQQQQQQQQQQMQQQQPQDLFNTPQLNMMNPNLLLGLSAGLPSLGGEPDPRQQHLYLSNLVALQQHQQQQLYQAIHMLNNKKNAGASQHGGVNTQINSQGNQFVGGNHAQQPNQFVGSQAPQQSSFAGQQTQQNQFVGNQPAQNQYVGSTPGQSQFGNPQQNQFSLGLMAEQAYLLSLHQLMNQQASHMLSEYNNQQAFMAQKMQMDPSMNAGDVQPSMQEMQQQQQQIQGRSSKLRGQQQQQQQQVVSANQQQIIGDKQKQQPLAVDGRPQPQQLSESSTSSNASAQFNTQPQELRADHAYKSQRTSAELLKQGLGSNQVLDQKSSGVKQKHLGMFAKYQMKFRGDKGMGGAGGEIGGSPSAMMGQEQSMLAKQDDSMMMKDDSLIQSVDGKIPKKKLKLRIKPKEESKVIRNSQREEQIRKQVEEEMRKLLKTEFEELKQKLEEQESTIQDLKFELKFSEGVLKKNKKEIKSMNYSLEVCYAQITSIIRVFIQVLKYFLTKCVRQQSNQYGCATSMSNYSHINPLGVISNPGGFGKAALDGTMSSMTVTEHMLDRSFEDDRRNMFEQIKSILISKMQVIQQTIKQIDLTKEIQQVRDWHYDNFTEKKSIIQSPIASLMNRNKSLHASNPRKGSIAVRTSFNQAPSLRNLLTVRTQNSDKNPKNAFSKTEYEEFELNEDGGEEMPLNKLVGITAGKSTNENNNSLIMGSFENFDLGANEAKDMVGGQQPHVQDFNDLGNNSSVKGFFNIDIDHDITPVNTSKNKIFMEEFSVEPSEFDNQIMAGGKNKPIVNKGGGENSTKQRNNMNMSEFSRLSSNYQQYKTNNKNRLNANGNPDSFNGSSQRKPSHSYEGIETPLVCEEVTDVRDKEAKFRINFEPFNENKSIDQQNGVQKRSSSNMARKDFQKNMNFTHRGNVLVTDYSFDSFVDGFNARDKLEIDNLYKMKGNNSIYQPSFFGKFNNETCSHGNISHQHFRQKNQSDGGHGGSGESFTLSNHNKDNNLFTSFHVQNRNEKLLDKYKIDGSISESKQRDRGKGGNAIQLNQARGSFHNDKPRINVNEIKNSDFLGNVESPILIKASRSVFNENTQKKYFDIPMDGLSGLGRSQMKRASGKQVNFLDDETHLDSKPFMNLELDYERNSQQSARNEQTQPENHDTHQQQVSKFMGGIIHRDQMVKIDSAENLCKPDHEQLLRTTSNDNKLLTTNKPSLWNRNPKHNDSADFGSFQNTNEGNLSNGEDIVSFDNLRKHMKKRNEAEETLGVVKISSHSQINKGQSGAIMDSSGSLHRRIKEVPQKNVGKLSEGTDPKLNPDEFDIREEELPMFGHQHSNKSNVDSKHNNGSEHSPNSGDFGQQYINTTPKNFIIQKQNSTKNFTENTLKPDTDHMLNKSGTNFAVKSNHQQEAKNEHEEKQHNFAYDSFCGSFGDMGGSIRSSSRNSFIEKAASDHNGSEESVELLMKKSAQSANLNCDWQQQKTKVNSGLVKLAKQKTGKFSKQSTLYYMKRGKIINSYFRDSETQSPKQPKNNLSNVAELKLDAEKISITDQNNNQGYQEVIDIKSGNVGSGSNMKIQETDAQSVHQVPNFYQPEEDQSQEQNPQQTSVPVAILEPNLQKQLKEAEKLEHRHQQQLSTLALFHSGADNLSTQHMSSLQGGGPAAHSSSVGVNNHNSAVSNTGGGHQPQDEPASPLIGVQNVDEDDYKPVEQSQPSKKQ